jgi:hypothetical protein
LTNLVWVIRGSTLSEALVVECAGPCRSGGGAARAASALNHPQIVTIHEVESVDGVDFMVMESVPGTTLDALIPSKGMAVQDALRIAIQIADALAAAHEHGIVLITLYGSLTIRVAVTNRR